MRARLPLWGFSEGWLSTETRCRCHNCGPDRFSYALPGNNYYRGSRSSGARRRDIEIAYRRLNLRSDVVPIELRIFCKRRLRNSIAERFVQTDLFKS